MAQVLKGSFNTTAYDNRFLTFSWTATQDISKNQSTISWTLKGAGSQTQYFMSAPFKVVIAGETVYESSTRIQLKNGTVVSSGTKVITHSADGSKSFTVSVSAAIYSKSVNCSGSGTWELQTIPRKATITSAPNFNDLNIPTVTYSNPAGSAVTKLELGIFDSEGGATLAAYREVSKTETSYTFQFTEAERNNLRNYTPNSNTATVKFYIRTTIGTDKYHDSVSKTLTIVNANPVLSVTIDDRDEYAYRVTGDSKCIIRNYSVLYVSCYANTLKAATLKEISITNSGKTTKNAEETFMNPTDSVVTCRAQDSRGNVTTNTIDLANNSLGYSWVPYIVPTCSMRVSMTLDTSTTSKATITASGDYYNNTIGATTNSLTLSYGIWEEGNDTALYTGVFSNVTLNSNKYSATKEVAGLDYQKTYRFRCWAKDIIYNNVYSDVMSLSTLPVFDWGKDNFNFNVPVNVNGLNLSGAAKALSNYYHFPVEYTICSNYDSTAESTDATAYLLGNNLRIYFYAKRNQSVAAGNITNEDVMIVKVNHGGKIKSCFNVAFPTSSTGGVATFVTTGDSNNNGVLQFTIRLCAVANASTEFSGSFCMPVILNLDKF